MFLISILCEGWLEIVSCCGAFLCFMAAWQFHCYATNLIVLSSSAEWVPAEKPNISDENSQNTSWLPPRTSKKKKEKKKTNKKQTNKKTHKWIIF